MTTNKNICPICGFSPLTHKGSELICPSCDSHFSIVATENTETESLSLDELKKSVFEIKGQSETTEKFGTGFAISGKHIITCAHVIYDGEKSDGTFRYLDSNLFVGKDKNFSTNAEVVKISKSFDLAVIKVNRKAPLSPLKLDKKKPYEGTSIYAVGNGKGNGISVLRGVVSDRRRNVNGRDLILISAPVISGYSGGPVFNNYGLVVGVITGGENDEPAMNYAIPSDIVYEFAKEYLD